MTNLLPAFIDELAQITEEGSVKIASPLADVARGALYTSKTTSAHRRGKQFKALTRAPHAGSPNPHLPWDERLMKGSL